MVVVGTCNKTAQTEVHDADDHHHHNSPCRDPGDRSRPHCGSRTGDSVAEST